MKKSKYFIQYRTNARSIERTRGAVLGWGESWETWNVIRTPRVIRTHYMPWNVSEDGMPSAENLEKWRVAMNESCQRGGKNYSVSKAFGVLVHISHARIIERSTRKMIASVTMPMFESI